MKISKVEPVFDRGALGCAHVFFRIRSDGPYIKRGAGILDSPLFEGCVEAVSFCEGAVAWAMLPAGCDAGRLVGDAVAQSGDDSLSYEAVPVGEVPDRELLSLLLASLARSRFESPPCSNVGGRLLVVSPKHVRRSGGRAIAAHAVDVGVSADMYLALKVRTFTSLSQRRFIRSRVPLERLPRYELVNNAFMRRAFHRGADDPDAFVERASGSGRYRVPFLDISSSEGFHASKVGIMGEVLQRLEERYGDAVLLRFAEVADSCRIECRTAKAPEWRKRVSGCLDGRDVLVVDATGENAETAQSVADAVAEAFGVPASVAEEVFAEGLNLRLIHEDGFYGEGADPHDASFGAAVVQHLTVESADKDGRIPAVKVESVVKELAVKLDVAQGRMTLVDWPALGLGGPWSFGLRIDPDGPDDEARFAFLDVGPDSSMRFSLEVLDLFGTCEHQDMVDALTLHAGAESVVRGPEGDVNAVSATEIYTLPNHAEIARVFADDGVVSRGREGRALLLSDVTDIAFAPCGDDAGYYRVGVVGYGMNRTIVNASLLREVRTVEGSRLLFPDALKLMDADFVRMRELSITMFPLKYLREWVRASFPELTDQLSR